MAQTPAAVDEMARVIAMDPVEPAQPELEGQPASPSKRSTDIDRDVEYFRQKMAKHKDTKKYVIMPDTTMRWPLYASTACAEPRMWPAGAKPTSTSPIRTLSPYFRGCCVVSGMSWKRVRMMASVSGVASAARWPGRAWSP